MVNNDSFLLKYDYVSPAFDMQIQALNHGTDKPINTQSYFHFARRCKSWGMINILGEEVIPLAFTRIEFVFRNYIKVYKKYEVCVEEGIIEPDFDNALSGVVTKTPPTFLQLELCGLYTHSGHPIIDCRCVKIDMHEDFFIAHQLNERGYPGCLVFNNRFSYDDVKVVVFRTLSNGDSFNVFNELFPFQDGLAPARQGKRWFYVDSWFKEVTDYKIDCFFKEFQPGIDYVSVENKKCYFKRSDEKFLDEQMIPIPEFNDHLNKEYPF